VCEFVDESHRFEPLVPQDAFPNEDVVWGGHWYFNLYLLGTQTNSSQALHIPLTLHFKLRFERILVWVLSFIQTSRRSLKFRSELIIVPDRLQRKGWYICLQSAKCWLCLSCKDGYTLETLDIYGIVNGHEKVNIAGVSIPNISCRNSVLILVYRHFVT
jgi:hypothetical protein